MAETKLHKAIMQVRVDLQKKNLKKSGKNSYAGFEYFELADFMPQLNELMLKNGIADVFSIKNEEVHLMLTNGTEQINYYLPFKHFDTPLNKSNQKQMQDIQYFGALDTYYKRYIYMNAFGITDGDIIDAMDNNSLRGDGNNKSSKPKAQYQKKQPVKKDAKTDEANALFAKLKNRGVIDKTIMDYIAQYIADTGKPDTIDTKIEAMKELDAKMDENMKKGESE